MARKMVSLILTQCLEHEIHVIPEWTQKVSGGRAWSASLNDTSSSASHTTGPENRAGTPKFSPQNCFTAHGNLLELR